MNMEAKLQLLDFLVINKENISSRYMMFCLKRKQYGKYHHSMVTRFAFILDAPMLNVMPWNSLPKPG